MLFNSLDFLLFFSLVWFLQGVLPHRPRNLLLLAASYFFYACWDWRFLSLIILSTVIDFYCGLAISQTEDYVRKKRLVAASAAFNLVILGFFKYANFFVDSAGSLLGGLGINAASWHLDIVLPVGISFYTFKTMSYTIDIYRGETEAVKDFAEFALFVSFFPQLLAGPIERAKNLLPQLTKKQLITEEMMRVGLWLAFWGFFKKLVIADNMSPIVDEAFGNYRSLTGGEVMVASYAFAFQIYADFSGYTDIARGIAKLMGYELMLNFRLPYLATNPSDFWRRWHISLSSWLRDYLYIPLGGNRHGPVRTNINLMLTMLIGGLWHGAAWTFVIWGGYHGLLLVGHRLILPVISRVSPRSTSGKSIWWVVRVIIFFQFTCLGWLIFRAQSFEQIGTMLGAVFSDFALTEGALRWLWQVLLLCLPLMAVQGLQGLSRDTNIVLKLSLFCRSAVYTCLILMLLGVGSIGSREFIYFQF